MFCHSSATAFSSDHASPLHAHATAQKSAGRIGRGHAAWTALSPAARFTACAWRPQAVASPCALARVPSAHARSSGLRRTPAAQACSHASADSAERSSTQYDTSCRVRKRRCAWRPRSAGRAAAGRNSPRSSAARPGPSSVRLSSSQANGLRHGRGSRSAENVRKQGVHCRGVRPVPRRSAGCECRPRHGGPTVS